MEKSDQVRTLVMQLKFLNQTLTFDRAFGFIDGILL